MEKSDLIEILQRPVRDCEMAHENVRRNKETDEPLLPLLFTLECDISEQHLGCVHLLDVLLNGTPGTGDVGILSKILVETNSELLQILRGFYKKLTTHDNDMRIARTGKAFEDQSLTTG